MARQTNLKHSLLKPSSTVYCQTDSEAAALLILNAHYDRALEFIPDALRVSVSDVAIYCDLSREEVAPCFRKRKLVRMQSQTTPRRRVAIEKMAQLLREGEQSVDGRVPVSRIREALKPWL
jgi:hypothetical protein